MSRYAYSAEVQRFIADNVQGRTTKELVQLVNKKFDLDFTDSKMKSYKSNHKLKSGTPTGASAGKPSEKYPKKVKDFIYKNYVGTGHQAMADMLNQKFGTQYTKADVKSYYSNHKLNSGLTGRFEKNHTPANKGKKGIHTPGSEKGWFKKGSMPKNHKPVGSERIDNKDGYTSVKTAEPNVWKLKHKLIWEEANGPIPPGHVVTFLDGDKTNFNLDNMALISNAEHLQLIRSGLRCSDSELTKTGILITKVIRASKQKPPTDGNL